ncbi:hypothetical protein VTO42DRAFT_2795 [Malbranchea cinnamomea]
MDYQLFQHCEKLAILLRYAATAPSGYKASRFKKLREVYIRKLDGLYSIYIKNDIVDRSPALLMKLFYVPSLEILKLTIVDMEPVILRQVGGTPKLPRLHTLRLVNSELNSERIGTLLSATPNLRTFEFNFMMEQSSDLFFRGRCSSQKKLNRQNEWRTPASSLELVASTLENLTISADYYNFSEQQHLWPILLEWIMADWEWRGRFKPLKSFIKLKRLEIPLLALLDWTLSFPDIKLRDFVPPNLRELYLRDDLNEAPGYAWTPVDQTFLSNFLKFDATPIVQQLEDYLLCGFQDTKQRFTLKKTLS